jgi:hypothetical protein
MYSEEDYIIDLSDCSEENLSKLISSKNEKEIIINDTSFQFRVLQIFEPTEMM